MSIHKSDAEQLVERARSTTNDQVRQDLLENIFDLIFNKEPALLVEQFPSLLSFWCAPVSKVKKEDDNDKEIKSETTNLWLLGCIENACVSHAELISLSLPIIMKGIEFDKTIIQQNAIRVMTVLYPHILFLIANASFISPSHLASWNYLIAIKTKIFQLFDKKTATSVLIQVIKLVEVIVLLQSDPDPTSQNPFIFTLKQIPSHHTILNAQSLSNEVPKIIALFGEKLVDFQSGISTLVIMNSLSRIAKERDKYVNPIFTLLIQHFGTCSTLGTELEGKIKQITRSIKSALLSVIKRKPACISWTDELSTTLSSLGAAEIANRYKSHKASFMEGSDSDDELVESVTTVRKLLLKNKTKHEIVPTPLLKMQLAEFQKLPLSLVVSVVEAGIKTLEFPDQLEPLDLPGYNDENTLVNLLASAISPDHRQQRFKKKSDREKEPQINADTSSFAITLQENATPFGTPFGQSITNNDNNMLQEKKLKEEDEKNRGQKRKAAILSSQHPQFPRKRMSLSSSGNKEDITAKLVIRPTTNLRTPQLNKRMVDKLSTEVYTRIVNNEKSCIENGQILLHTQIMSHLTLKLPLDDPILQSIIDYIVALYPKRNDIALQWLFSEWQSDEIRYCEILKRILYSFKPKLKSSNDNAPFNSFLLKIPVITEDVFMFLSEYCDDADRSSIGIFSLRDLIIHRPQCRTPGLKLLLRYTAHNNDLLRGPAIRLVISHLLPYTMFEPRIINFAKMLINTLLENKDKKHAPKKQAASTQGMDEEAKVKAEGDNQPTENTKNEGNQNETTTVETNKPARIVPEKSEDDIKRRLILYFAVCAKKHEMIQGLVEVYMQVPQNVKKLMLRLSPGLIRTMGMNSPYLLELLKNFPADAKTFIIHILHTITESGFSPSPEMISIIREVYATRVKDQRLLIPILGCLTKQEIIDYLPDLLELPTNVLQVAILKILNNKSPTNPLSPVDLLIELHLIDKRLCPLKKLLQAIDICFEQKVIVKQEILSKVLSHLIEINPIPQLYLRTVITTIGKLSQMMGFIMGILKELIVKQIWNDAQLWIGFLKCVKTTMPYSIPVVLALPPIQLDEALQRNPSMVRDVLEYTKKNKLAAGLTGQPLDDGIIEILRKHETAPSTPSLNTTITNNNKNETVPPPNITNNNNSVNNSNTILAEENKNYDTPDEDESNNNYNNNNKIINNKNTNNENIEIRADNNEIIIEINNENIENNENIGMEVDS